MREFKKIILVALALSFLCVAFGLFLFSFEEVFSGLSAWYSDDASIQEIELHHLLLAISPAILILGLRVIGKLLTPQPKRMH